jgi:hypothetical protein
MAKHNSRVRIYCSGVRNATFACGSKVLYLFFVVDFRPLGENQPQKEERVPQLLSLPKAETAPERM